MSLVSFTLTGCGLVPIRDRQPSPIVGQPMAPVSPDWYPSNPKIVYCVDIKSRYSMSQGALGLVIIDQERNKAYLYNENTKNWDGLGQKNGALPVR